MTIIEHSVPRLESDTDIPGASDPRLQPFFKQLVDQGVMDANRIIRKTCRLRRGFNLTNWLWRLEVHDAATTETADSAFQ